MPDATPDTGLGWQQADLVPRPDPTVLTNKAITEVTEEYRREIGQSRELLEHRLGELERRLDTARDNAEQLNLQRYREIKEQLATGQQTAKEAVQAALTSAKEAVTKAEAASEKRFESVNEFRNAMSDQTNTFIPRIEYDAGHASLSSRVDANVERLGALELRLTSRLDRGDGIDSGSASARSERRLDTGQAVAVLVAVVIAVGVVVSILTFAHK